MEHMSAILQALEAQDRIYRQTGPDTVELNFGGQHVDYRVRLLCDPPLVTLIASPPVRVPAEQLVESIQLANLLNARVLRWGCFWVDPESRQLTFEGTLIAPEPPSQEQIQLAFVALCVDFCWPAFARVLWAGETADAALTTFRAMVSADEEAAASETEEAASGPVAEDDSPSDLEAAGPEQIV